MLKKKNKLCVQIMQKSLTAWKNHDSDTVMFLMSVKFLRIINPTCSSPKGGCNNPPNNFRHGAKIAQPRGKIAPGTFTFIISLHFSEKISNLPPKAYTGCRVSFQSWEVRGVGAIPWFLNWIILKIFEVICTPNFVCKLECPFSNIFCKKIPWKSHVFTIFFT